MKTIYLTFDDGPSQTTPLLLDVLKRNHVRASFFVTNLYNHSRLLPDIAESGHIVCLHSYCHDYKRLYSDPAFFFEDLEKIRNQVRMKTGQDTMIYRFPGGTDNFPLVRLGGFQVYELLQTLKENGYRVYDWDCQNLDGANSELSADQYFENAMRSIRDRDHAIFLSHARPCDQQSILSLNQLIPALRNRGFQFDTLDHYADSHYRVDGTYHLKPELRIVSDRDAFLVKNASGETVLPISAKEYSFIMNKCNNAYRLDIQHTDDDVSVFTHLYLSSILGAGLYTPSPKQRTLDG